jgi:hypothetical protein
MEHGIESMPQDIRPMKFANRTIVAMAKHMLEISKA